MKMMDITFSISVTFLANNGVTEDQILEAIDFFVKRNSKNKNHRKFRVYDSDLLEYDLRLEEPSFMELSDGDRSLISRVG